MGSLALLLKSGRGGQRFFIVIVALAPLLIFLAACVPAVIFASFRRDGFERCAVLADRFEGWTREVLKASTAVSIGTDS
jgi:hypothetical protein